MSEYTTVYQFFFGLIGLAVGCLFYMLGGRSGKWKRRFISSFIVASTINGLFAWRGNFHPWLLAMYPILIIGTSLGYGADVLRDKVTKRSIYTAAFCMTGLVCVYLIGGISRGVFALQVGIGIWSIYLGVKNPIEAPAEEGMICTLLTLPLLAYPFITWNL